MWNIPTKERMAKILQLYKTEHIPLCEKKIYMHFFLAGCDWYSDNVIEVLAITNRTKQPTIKE